MYARIWAGEGRAHAGLTFDETASVEMHRTPCVCLGAGWGQYTRLLLAAGVFALAVLVYLLDRPAGSSPHLSALHALAAWPEYSFGRLGQHLPTFAHVFTFSVLTAAWLGPSWHAKACVAWLATNTAFEVGQHADVAGMIGSLVPPGVEPAPLVSALASYARNGTFDPWDLVSMGVGAVAAYVLLRYPRA